MPTLKTEQYKKWSSVLPDGWKFNAQHYVVWGEKEICTDSTENDKGVFYRLTLRYRAETEPGGYSQRETGRQIPTVSISRYTPTGSGLFSVVYIFSDAAGEPEGKKVYNALVKIAASIDTAELFRRAVEKDTGKSYNDLSEFWGKAEEATESSDSATKEAEEATEAEKVAESTSEGKSTAEEQETGAADTTQPNEEAAEAVQVEETETEPEEAAEEAPEAPAPDQTAEAAPDMFATLAAAYLSGKTIKSSPRRIERKEPEKTEEEPEEELREEPEPVKEPEPPGFHETNNDRFTDEERAALSAGSVVRKDGLYKSKDFYFSAEYCKGVRLVYSVHGWNDEARLKPGRVPEYSGFLAGMDFYNDPSKIREKLNSDINDYVSSRIPSESAAAENVKKNAGNVSEYEQKQIEDCLNADYTREARDLFFRRVKPGLSLYAGEDHDIETLIDYILQPERMIEQAATEYIKFRAAGIYRAYIRFNRISSALLAIESDKQNSEHTLRKIAESVSDEKTVKIELTSGHAVKVEARGVKNITSLGTISDYNVLACDRQYLRKNQYGRSEDIQYTEIKSITHGQRVLYNA